MSQLRKEFDREFRKSFGEDWTIAEKAGATWGFLLGMKKAAEIVRQKVLKGHYKDCPAAWLTDAHKKFDEDILSAVKEFEDGK